MKRPARHSRRVSAAGRRSHHRRLRIEPLEERRLLAATPQLIDTIQLPRGGIGEIDPEIVDVNGVVYFAAEDNDHGVELWRSDGTAAGTYLLKDIRTGPVDSLPRYLTNVNGTLFFMAEVDNGIFELWKSNGTTAGTQLVLNVSEYGASLLTQSGGLLYFVGGDNRGYGLWRSDGTEAGTFLLEPSDSLPEFEALTDVDGTLYFVDRFYTNLWKTNGTPESTVLITDQGASNLSNHGGQLYFTRGAQLWKSDGTAEGTTLIEEIAAPELNFTLHSFATFDDALYFVASHSSGRWQLWKSDGSAAGTTLVQSGGEDFLFGGAYNLAATDNLLYFQVQFQEELELWRSDGTTLGTYRIKDSIFGDSGFDLPEMVGLGDVLYFRCDEGTSDTELWRTDGTEAGTVRVKDIYPGTRGSTPSELTVSAGQLFFVANDPLTGTELWTSNGTEAGTNLVRDLMWGTYGSSVNNFTTVGDSLYFTNYNLDSLDPFAGAELWKSDGTRAGTSRIKSITAKFLTNVNGQLFFSGQSSPSSGPRHLWKSDGTEAGTQLVKNVEADEYGANPGGFKAVGNTLFFVGRGDGLEGHELWKSDGTEAGTFLLKDIRTGGEGSLISQMTEYKGMLFFQAYSESLGRELWRSDGTPEGTVNLKNIATGGASSSPSYLTVVGDTLYFAAQQAGVGIELWKTDGTEAGTVLVKDIALGSVGSAVAELTNVNGTLFFRATEASGGSEIWKSDGTEAGTIRVKDIRPSSFGSNPQKLTNAGGTLYFVANDGATGNELWKSDGTETGTVRVADLGSGPAHSSFLDLASVDGTLYFSMNEPDGIGVTVRRTDGTEPGTVIVKRFETFSGSTLHDFAGTLAFRADDGVHGLELWLHGPAAELTGDFNGDGAVDNLDEQVWRNEFGRSDTAITADVNFDGIVDLADYTLWRDNFGNSKPLAAGQAAVVEPVTEFAAAQVSLTISAPLPTLPQDRLHQRPTTIRQPSTALPSQDRLHAQLLDRVLTNVARRPDNLELEDDSPAPVPSGESEQSLDLAILDLFGA